MKFPAFLLLLAVNVIAAPADWAIRDAPFRAVVRLENPGNTGIAIILPEFGHTLPGLADALLTDNTGRIVPLAPVWRGEGLSALFLAQEMKPDIDYFLYFGGGKHRPGKTWKPQISLLLETRRLPARFKPSDLDDGKSLQAAWELANESDGAGWVKEIFTGGNPFGPSRNYLSRYTGYLRTDKMKELTLYTQSSDASFVFVNGKLEFGWPGRHGGGADANTARRKTVAIEGPVTRIDYYHGKMDGDQPGTVLGWERNKVLAPIPASEWLHPGAAKVLRIEDAAGREVKMPVLRAKSALGFGGYWFYEIESEPPRVAVGPGPWRVSVEAPVRMVRQLNFSEAIPQASINNREDMRRYLRLLAQENPAALPLGSNAAFFTLAESFGDIELAARFAGAYLKQTADASDKFWAPAMLTWLRGLAQTNPRQALLELRRVEPGARTRNALQFDGLELEILAFHLRDATIVQRATVLATQFPRSHIARLAGVRMGDYYRLNGQIAEATAQYRRVQNTIVEESAGRKLPAQDRAYSITVTDLIERGHRVEAEEKLVEWETRHPLTKLTSDFLLLRARMLMMFGRWREAVAEMDSFEKLQPDSPYQIAAAFYRAQALNELGKKEEARKLWESIYKNYPRHELAAKSKERVERQ